MGKLLDQAIQVATKAHDGQYRKGSVNGASLPYITHPTQVMICMWKWGFGTEEIMAAAMLHDVLEDTDCDIYADTYWGWADSGPMLKIVEELTHDPEKETKEEYLKSFLDPTKKSIEALVIKIADRINNTCDFFFDSDAQGYAGKYFRKAECLGEALSDRMNEIREKFGQEPAARLESQWLSIKRLCA